MIGDAVNLASRLEGMSKVYGVDIVASETTKHLTPGFVWQELDKVRVKGKERAVTIWHPLALAGAVDTATLEEVKLWAQVLKSYRGQNWDQADVGLLNVSRLNANKFLYRLYAERVASMRFLPFDPQWDGATNFETK